MAKTWLWLGVALVALPFVTSGLFKSAPNASQSQVVVTASDEIAEAEQATLEQHQATQAQLAGMRSDLAGSQLDSLLNERLSAQMERTKATLIATVSARADHLLQVARQANQTDGVGVLDKVTQLCYGNSRRAADQAIESGIRQYAADAENFDSMRTFTMEDHACSVAMIAASQGLSSVAYTPVSPAIWGDSAAFYSAVYAAQMAATEAPSIPDLNSNEVASNEQ